MAFNQVNTVLRQWYCYSAMAKSNIRNRLVLFIRTYTSLPTQSVWYTVEEMKGSGLLWDQETIVVLLILENFLVGCYTK